MYGDGNLSIFVFACLSFMMGTLCGIKLPLIQLVTIVSLVLFTFAVKLAVFRKIKYGNFCAIALILLFAAGSAFGYFYNHQRFKDVKALYGTDTAIHGRVSSLKSNGFVIDTGEYDVMVYDFSGSSNLYEGDVVEVFGRMESYPSSNFPADTDSKLYNASRGVLGRLYPESFKVTDHKPSYSVSILGDKMRALVRDRIYSSGCYSNEGLMLALLTGDTSELDDETRSDFNLTGTSHLLAVSGLHLGIFFSFFALVIGAFRKNKVTYIFINLFVMALYVIMVGGRASVLRAGVMFLLALFVGMADRRSDSLTNLSLTGVVLCLINPYYAVDVGFQLSFLSTFGIVLFARFFKRKMIAVPVIATLFMLPVTAYYFNSVPLSGVLLNIVLVSVVPVIIILGYLGCVFFPLASLCGAVLSHTLALVSACSSVSWLRFSLASPSPFVVVVWVFVVFFCYFMLDGFRYKEALISVGLAVCLFVLGTFGAAENVPNNKVNIINIGNYNMLHIITDSGANVLVDCGYDADSYVLKCGVDFFDVVIVTENRSTKYKGIEELCKNKRVGKLILPGSMEGKNFSLEKTKPVYYNQDSYNFKFDNVSFCAQRFDKRRIFTADVDGSTILIPINTKSISGLPPSDVILVPNNCTDCAAYECDNPSALFVHPTHGAALEGGAGHYVSCDTGMISINFFDYKIPSVKLQHEV